MATVRRNLPLPSVRADVRQKLAVSPRPSATTRRPLAPRPSGSNTVPLMVVFRTRRASRSRTPPGVEVGNGISGQWYFSLLARKVLAGSWNNQDLSGSQSKTATPSPSVSALARWLPDRLTVPLRRKGEKGSLVVYANTITRTELDVSTGEEDCCDGTE